MTLRFYSSLVKNFSFILILLVLSCLSFGFAQGQLGFEANGEDFVRQGFVSKDGWQIDFEHAFVNLSNIRAYQTNPPFEAKGELTNASQMIGLSGTYFVDLAEGDADASPILVASVDAPEGFYNALSWQMKPDMQNPSLRLEGSASKDGETVDFIIVSSQAFHYDCGTFIGEQRKGIVTSTAEAVTEMTFHFDHIFGDIDLDPADSLNQGALGFEPFAALAQEGMLDLQNEQLALQLSEEDYAKLSTEIFPNLGHVGEGHCFEGLSSASNP